MIHNDALLAEAYACKYAPEAAAYLGISRIVLETDSSQLKEALASSSMDLAIGGGLFRDLRDSLLDDFSCDSICNVSRVCNSVAHDIAKRGLSWDLGQFEVCTDPLPECVNSLCAREFAELMLFNERP